MKECLKREITYRTSRSSGPGGQHVNKTESKVELSWHLNNSICLSEKQKELIRQRLRSRMTDAGELIMQSEKYRSQYRNKEDVTARFLDLITMSLIPVKKRFATRPTRGSIERRIKHKKIRGEIKKSRRNGTDE